MVYNRTCLNSCGITEVQCRVPLLLLIAITLCARRPQSPPWSYCLVPRIKDGRLMGKVVSRSRGNERENINTHGLNHELSWYWVVEDFVIVLCLKLFDSIAQSKSQVSRPFMCEAPPGWKEILRLCDLLNMWWFQGSNCIYKAIPTAPCTLCLTHVPQCGAFRTHPLTCP